ncbi:tetratricopeptide repeat protein [Dactylosporangium darangshiense]|uniref:tetratricopeptide repeat protein n=1 Tax=Dactylosporangium darangshiense TaxID=579108 RepID=UPI0031F190B4
MINADLHVFQDRGPVYLLTEYRPTPVPLPAGLPAQPSRLLNARFRVVAFTGREQELAELSRWRDVQGLRLSVRWLHGPGGAGKTRLAAELADASVVKGWKVVTAVHGPGSIQLPPGSQDMRTDNAAGLLLVVDYADRWPLSHLTWLMSNAMLHRDVPTRVLLLARSAYPWPAVRAAFSELAADCSDQLHGPLPGHAAPAVRHHMFAAARDAFAARYGLADPSRIAPPPELGHPDFGLTLNVHMAALVAVDARARGDTVAADPVALTVYLLDREHRHWTQLYQNRVEGTEHDTPPSVMARLVFTAALTGPMGHGGGAQLLRALDLPGHPDRLLTDHRACYPPEEPGAVLEPLYPDRLAEDFLALALPGHSVTGYTSAPWAAADAVTVISFGEGDDADQPAPHVRRAMTFLAAAAAPGRWPHVARHVADVLRANPALAAAAGGGALAALAELDDLDADVLAAVAAHLPEYQQADLDLGVAAIAERLTAHQLASTTDPVTRAQLHTTLARRLANAGLHQRAGVAAGQAVATLRALAETDPGAADPDLAAALYQHCRALVGLGQRTEPLAAIEQAAAIYRRLADVDGAYLPQLASTLYMLGRALSDPGQMQQAIAVAEESVAVYRALVNTDPQAPLADLATALNSLGLRLDMAGRPLEGLGPLRDSLAIRRTLAEADPARFLSDLATSLNNIGGVLPHLDRREEALAATEEALAIRRRLAQINPHAYQVPLAISLSNLGMRLSELGQDDQAVAALREAVATNRALVEINPGANRQFLVQSLYNLAGQLFGFAGRPSDAHRREAAVLGEEAVAVARLLAADRPASYLPLLAKCLNNLSSTLSSLRRDKQALRCIEEAVAIREKLADGNEDNQLADLANSLENLATTLANLRRHKQSRIPQERAAAIRHQLATRRPDAIAAARSLADTSRSLAEVDPDEYLPDLAAALALIHRWD